MRLSEVTVQYVVGNVAKIKWSDGHYAQFYLRFQNTQNTRSLEKMDPSAAIATNTNLVMEDNEKNGSLDLERGEKESIGDGHSNGKLQCCKTFNFAGTTLNNVNVGISRTASFFVFLTIVLVLVITAVLVILYDLNHITIHAEAK